MAWPTTGVGVGDPETLATGILASGDATYFRWGTAGLWSVYVVTRATQRLKKDDLQYENGDGVQSGRVQVLHGTVWELTVRDDRRMSLPTVGTYGTLVDMAGYLGAVGVTHPGYILDNSYDTAPKQPGERVMVFECITLIKGEGA